MKNIRNIIWHSRRIPELQGNSISNAERKTRAGLDWPLFAQTWDKILNPIWNNLKP